MIREHTRKGPDEPSLRLADQGSISAFIRGSSLRYIRALFSQVTDELFPPLCTICELPLVQCSSWTSRIICSGCEPTEFHPSGNQDTSDLCARCNELLLSSETNGICEPCTGSPIVAGTVRSMWWYDGVVEELICALKYGSRYDLARPLGKALAGWLDALKPRLPEPRWDVVVPVPSTVQSMRARGYHHTKIIASMVAASLAVALDSRCLSAIGKRAPQASLEAADRSRNVKGGFCAAHRGSRLRGRNLGLAGSRVLLIDDVITSGATATEINRVLQAEGAEQVDVLTLARARRFRRYRTEIMLARTS